jgi:hypothetical protein
MFAAIVSIVLALISFFTARRKGASDTTAALAGIGAGAGAYYVTTQTEWGKDVVSAIDNTWINLTSPSGTPLKNKDGTDAKAPEGAIPQKDAAGNVLRDDSGNIMWKLLDTTGNVVKTGGQVLSSWGPTGTAAVIGTSALATGSVDKKWMLWAAAGVAAFLILK